MARQCEIVNEKFFERFGVDAMQLTLISLVCSMCDKKIVLNEGITFPDHGLNLCKECLDEVHSRLCNRFGG